MNHGGANLAMVLEARARERGWLARPAYLVGDAVVTHGEVHDVAARTATVMSGLGVRPSERVMIALADGPELVWAFLGALRLGAVAVPVNPTLTADDHRHLAEEARPMLVVCRAELAPRFAGCWILLGEDLAAIAADAAPHPGVPAAARTPAYAQFTSGTTGRPKAAVHGHGDALVYHQAFAVGAIALGEDDVSLSVSKMHFAYGLGNSLFFPLLAGCRAVLLAAHPRPEAVSDLAHRHQATVLFAVPTFYARLVAGGGGWAGSLRVAVSAGEALIVSLAHRARELLSCPILDGLGSTEVGQTFVSNTLRGVRDATVGRVLDPYEVQVRDGLGRTAEPGNLGTLWVRGPTVLLEYLDRPVAAATDRDGDWLCTRDRAVMDDDGFVSLRGRIDDIELVGGINVAPTEVEDVLSAVPGVLEVAVAGVREGGGASHLEAFVVAAPDAVNDLDAEVVQAARDKLARHLVPRVVHLVEELPRTPTGKLRRFVLRSGAWSDGSRARSSRAHRQVEPQP